MHEDLNRVIIKPYTERAEGDGTNDVTVAAESWSKHLMRENSIITDLIGSQMRSQLTCPDCGKMTVNFEYQQTLQIAIPRTLKQQIVKVLYVPTEIPKLFSRPLSKIRAINEKMLSIRVLAMRPIQFAIKIDSSQPIKVLMNEFIEKVTQYLITTEQKIATLIHDFQQLDATLEGKAKLFLHSSLESIARDFDLLKYQNVFLFELGSKPQFNQQNVHLSRIYTDTEQISRISNDVVVGAYSSMESPKKILLMQVLN